MGMALNRAAFMRKARRFVASFIPFILAVSSLSAISVITAPSANANTAGTIDRAWSKNDTPGNYASFTGNVIPSSSSAAWTFETWIYPNSTSINDNNEFYGIFSQQQDTATTNRTSMWLYKGNIHYSTGGTNNSTFTGFKFEASHWYHVALTSNGSTTAKLFVNGVEVGSQSLTQGTSGGTFTVGGTLQSSQREFAGHIDQTKVWNLALTSEQLTQSMHTYGVPSSVSSNNLMAHYDFNDFTSSGISDKSGRNNNLTFNAANSSTDFTDSAIIESSTVNSDESVIQFKRTYLTSAGGWTHPIGYSTFRSLVIAGGGGGGAWVGGGGGAGGYVETNSTAIASTTIGVKIGQGGRGTYNKGNNFTDDSVKQIAANGQDSVLGAVATAVGGGAGASYWPNSDAYGALFADLVAKSGGSGGGGSGFANQSYTSDHRAGAAGTSGQGSNGGSGISNSWQAAGGGGANSVGSNGVGGGTTFGGDTYAGGAGGAGKTSNITGTDIVRAGGGGGGDHDNSSRSGAGGTGGGGAGGITGVSGTANTGGGGGGGANAGINASRGGMGGAGVVILRYKYTVISANSLDSKITAPVRGATPSTTAVDDTQFTGTVAWFESNGTTAAPSTFAANTIYIAKVTLTAKSGYTLNDLTGTFTFTGATTVSYSSGVITITFPATAHPSCSQTSSSSGGYTTLIFSTVQTCSWSVPAGVTAADVLVVGGGGGGSGNWSGSAGAGGSGGGGGVYTATAVPISGSVNVVVGAGGAGGTAGTDRTLVSGSPGTTSAFGSLSAGGGGGGGCPTAGAANGSACTDASIKGRSGTAAGNGGSPSNFWNAYNYGEPGTASNTTIGGVTFNAINGYRGGIYVSASSTGNSAGSGGGAGGAGTYNTPGAGVTSSLTGSSIYGKGGSSWNSSTWNLDSLPANTGWGGNGAYSADGSATNGVMGSSGVVVVRYINTPVISLSSTSISSVVGTAVTSYTISNSGGVAASYSISPSLAVSGLSFSTSTGQISGTPTAIASSATYTITATNTSGTSTATFSISSIYSSCSPSSTTSNGYTTLTFTSLATCNWNTPTGISKTQILIVGGGGGGGDSNSIGSYTGGAGGAGGFFTSSSVNINGTILVSVGAGGAGASSSTTNGSSGGDSSFGTLKVGGGGYGNSVSFPTSQAAGAGAGGSDYVSGGSGGGGRSRGAGDNDAKLGGSGGSIASSGVTFLGSTYSGYAGASGENAYSGDFQSGGQGGAITASNRTSSISGSSVVYAKGGTFRPWDSVSNTAAPKTYGSGGAANYNYGLAETSGNTLGGAGEQGIIILKYATIVEYTYNANSGSGSAPTGGSAQGGTSFTTAANPFTRTGYTFSGWNTAANGSGTALTENASNTMPVSATSIVLYAQWTASSVTITTPSSGLSGTIGTSFTLNSSVSGGTGSGTYALASGSLPGSVTLNTSTGVISGTPSSAGTFSVTVRFTDASGSVATTNSFSIVISSLKLSTPSAPTVSTTAGSATSITVTFTSVSNATSHSAQLFDSGGTQIGSNYTNFTSGSKISGLTANTAYSVKIIAVGDGTNYTNSDPSTAGTVTTSSAYFLSSSGSSSNYASTTNRVIPSTGNFTAEAWISPTDYNSSTRTSPMILSQGTFPNYFFLRLGSTGKLTVVRGNMTSAECSNSIVPKFTWSHVAIAVNGTSATCYLNGVAQLTINNLASDSLGTGFYVGGYSNNPNTVNATFAGQIDEVKIWSTVRTQQEIADNMEIAPIASATGLISYYPFDATSGTSAIDLKGTNNLTLGTTMSWLPLIRTISYAAGSDGTGSTADQTGVSDHTSAIVLKNAAGASGITRTGYTLSGWVTSGGTSYAAGSNYFGATDLSLVPTWTAASQTITYAAGTGGSGSAPTSPVSVNYGATFTTPANTYTRTGYSFAGWSDGTNTYAAGVTYPSSGSVSGNVTLTATWTLSTLTITYAAGTGGSGSAPTTPVSVSYGSTFTTPTNTYTRAGYTFGGWSDGTNTYAAGATYPSSGTASVNVTLTATWTANSLTVTYDSKGGSSVSSGSVNTGASISSAPTAPTKSGYTLSGWSATDGGTVITFPYSHGQTSSFTLYAVWAANALTVTYDSQGGSVVSNGSVNTGASISAAPTAPTKAGYTLTGWSATSTGSVVTFPYTHNQTANFTLYAIWTANTLTVTFDSQSGSVVSNGSVATDAKLTAPTAPTRTGYTFSGWSTTSTGSVVSFTGGYTHSQTANFTLYAIWTADGNTVAFNNNSGSGTMSNQTITSGTATALTTNSFTRTGYTFTGWNTSANGSGTAYTNGQSVTITAGMTLYAQWTGTANTITYDSKGGSAVSDGSFVTGGTVSAAPTAPTRAGYTLSGWSETDGGSVITYPFSPTATSGITLYAIWAAVSCSPTSTTTGGYTIYTFTTAGTCFWTVPNGVTDVEVLAVAGGAGGGYSYDNSGAGGGAGGQVKTGTLTLSTTAEVTVGSGGVGGTTSSRRGGSGGNSSISTISALGGTGGCGSRSACTTASQATSSAAANGGAGGSGGASGRGGGGSNTTAAAPTTAVAGAGTASTYSGSSVTYGAGGAGGTARGNTTNIVGTSGSANTGNGGGGASAKSSSGDVNGGAGGSGLVIVRIPSTLTVSFDSQSGSSVSDTSTVTAGVLSEPTAPTRSNYTFVGWFTATSGGSAITFPYSHGQTANFTLYARWTLNAYAIDFNANNGSGTMANQSVTHGVAANLNANLFTRANYVFHRWAVNADGSGTTYNNLAEVTLTAGTTLYAQWTANTYVVTYTYNNATGGNSTATASFTTGGSVIVLPTPTRTGYTFGGWYSDSGLNSQIGLAGADYRPTGTTLSLNAYAKWTAIDYTFTYDGNSSDGGTVPTETSKQIGQTATVKANTGSLTRAGYTFAGWNTQSNGSGDNYLSGSSFTIQSSNVTLYAKWSANSYTITYNSNGGSGSAQRSSTNVSSDTYTTGGSSVALPGVGTLTRSGYTFGGWNTSAAGTGTNRAATETYTTVSDVILYAKWNPVTYSITYDGNTSNGGSAPTTGGYTTGQATPYSVASNTYTKTLHVFGGWNTAANGSGTSYSPGSPITTLSDITLYAIWIPQYTLHYAINGGSVSSGSLPTDQLYNANTSVGPVFSTVSRTGYTFGGWRNGSTTVAAGGSFTIVEDSVLTAIWTPIDYTISYDSDGGTTPPNSFTKQIGQSFEVGSAVTKPGYNFTGWKAGSTTVGAGATVVTGSSNISYTAQWSAQVYRISYDWNGGRGTAVSDVDYTFGTSAITLPLVGDRVKDGYNFAGWAESANGSALGLTYTPSQTRTLYALWTLGNFTVTYDAGRGTVANSTVAVQNGSSTVLPLPTRANFVFNGWHTAVNGGSSIGSNGASFTPAASQTVYARWIQSSLYGITNSLSRIGSVITTSNVSNTFSGANSNSSVAVSIPENALPAGTTINFDLVSDPSRAQGVLPGVDYLVSIALSWLAADETVPDTASGKPISVTISNATIKAGAVAYAIVNNVSTLLGTATQDGSITISITSDPEIVVAATKPGAPTNVSASSNGNQQSVISWSAPSTNGGAEITGYTATANTGATCTTSGTSCTISGLADGTAYTFTVKATNSVGDSDASSSASSTTAAVYSVTFDAKGGTSVSNGSFLTASTVSAPTAPTRSGYSFAGWAATDGGTVELFPYTPGVTANITMYAKWDALDNNVTFDAKGGSSVTASIFASGGTVSEPTAPTRSGYTFAGWSATDGGSAVTFPYAPGVVTDITLYARWTAASSGGGGGSSGGSSNSNNSSSGSSNAGGVNAPGKNNVTVVAPVTVVGKKEAKVPTIEVSVPETGSSTKPAVLKVDAASAKVISEVKIVEGKLSLTPETGFSGKKIVTVTITENSVERVVQVPLTVLPEPVTKPILTPSTARKSVIRWTESPNATSYTVLLNGKKVCSTSASSCSISKILGPDAEIKIVSNGGDRTYSQRIEADFRQVNPVQVARLVSATITKRSLSKVDTKALDKAINLIRTQGFRTIVISEITTTKKTQALADARVQLIKKYIDDKTGSRNLIFEILPPAARTYFNNISLKG